MGQNLYYFSLIFIVVAVVLTCIYGSHKVNQKKAVCFYDWDDFIIAVAMIVGSIVCFYFGTALSADKKVMASAIVLTLSWLLFFGAIAYNIIRGIKLNRSIKVKGYLVATMVVMRVVIGVVIPIYFVYLYMGGSGTKRVDGESEETYRMRKSVDDLKAATERAIALAALSAFVSTLVHGRETTIEIINQRWIEQFGDPRVEEDVTDTTKEYDPYVVLDVSEDADQPVIEKAYREKIMAYHPDRVATLGDKLKKVALFQSKLINWAYSQICEQRHFAH